MKTVEKPLIRKCSVAAAFFFLFINWATAADHEDLIPLHSEPAEILVLKRSLWRNPDYEFFLWDKLDNILIFDTEDYTIQSLFFKKLAFYTEKLGFAGKVYKDDQLITKQGYNAHNYAAYDLAGYFNRAGKENLNFYEQQLRNILLANNIITSNNSVYYPVSGGVVSISRQSVPDLRAYLFVHELLHGIFYNFPEYQEGIYGIWKKLSNDEKEFWFLFFWSKEYITQDPVILINEFHAYLLQQSEKNISWMLLDRGVEEIRKNFPHKAEFADNFARQCGNCLQQTARKIADLLSDVGREAGFDYRTYLFSIRPY